MNRERLDRLVHAMNSAGVKEVLMVPSEELGWLTGHVPLLCERFQGLFVREDSEVFYFCNELTRTEASEMVGANRVWTWHDNESMTMRLAAALEIHGMGIHEVAVNGTARAFNILRIQEELPVRFIDGKALMESVTMIKTPDELDQLRRASRLTDEVMEEIIGAIRPGMTEGEIAARVREGFKSRGATPDFEIVACGAHTASPHYVGDGGVVAESDLVLLDIGCSVDGIKSDMTRTVFVGPPTEEMVRVYECVLAANQAGIAAAKRGVVVAEVDAAARQVIEAAGYGPCFTTRLGHGIGYSTHEAPYIKQGSDRILETGMAFSIEPGIYIEGRFGIRIEDLLMITPSGTEVINHADKSLRVITP